MKNARRETIKDKLMLSPDSIQLKSKEDIKNFTRYVTYALFPIDSFLIGYMCCVVIENLLKNKNFISTFFHELHYHIKDTAYSNKLLASIVWLKALYVLHKNKKIDDTTAVDYFIKFITIKEIRLFLSRPDFASQKNHEYFSHYMNYFTSLLEKVKGKDKVYETLISKVHYSKKLIHQVIKDYPSLKGKSKQKVLKLLGENFYLLNESRSHPNFLEIVLDIVSNLTYENEKDHKDNIISFLTHIFEKKYKKFISLLKGKLSREKKLVEKLSRSSFGSFLLCLAEYKIPHKMLEDTKICELIPFLPEEGFRTLFNVLYGSDSGIILLNHPAITRNKSAFLDLLRTYLRVVNLNTSSYYIFLKNDIPLIEIDSEIINQLEPELVFKLVKLSYIKFPRELRPVKFSFSKEALDEIGKKVFEFLVNEENNQVIANFFKAHKKT